MVLVFTIYKDWEVHLVALARAGTGTSVLLDKAALPHFVEQIARSYPVVGPVAKGKALSFEPLARPEEICLDYLNTILPPKKLFHAPLQTIFFFGEGEAKPPVEEAGKRVLFGVRPCDVNALRILDTVYTQEFPDPYYQNNRARTLIAALNCNQPGENCFCASLGTGPELETGYDLLLTDLGEAYLVEAGSRQGEELLALADLPPAPRFLQVEKAKRMEAARAAFKKGFSVEGLEKLLLDNFDHPLWEELKQQCLACGSCTMVCPTCFCYSVKDVVDLTLQNGRRERVWDSCMLLAYAAVALGGNFRKDREARLKHRLLHKLIYYRPQFGTLGCVGCGRCVTNCPVKIDPATVVAKLRGET
jgi:ferredoxin